MVCPDRHREQKRRPKDHVSESSHSHWIPWQGCRGQNHPKQRVIHCVVPGHQAYLDSGDRKSETTWHRCVVWGRLADYAATLTKGSHVRIEGEIRTREYTQKSGGKKSAEVKKSITEVRVTAIAKLDRPTKPDPEGAAA